MAVLFRRAGSGVELFWLKRSSNLAFAPGFYTFPGGRVEPGDAAVPVAGATGPEAQLRAAAARELFEEAGVLPGAGASASQELSSARRELLEGKTPFSALLSRLGLSLRAEDFQKAGRWITPPFMPRRYDTRFFLVETPAGAKAEAVAGEHSEGGWVSPAEALFRWERGSALLHPPALHALQVLAGFTSVAEAAARMSMPAHSPGFIATRIELQRGFRLFPLETPTLPPASHTNAYVLGNEELLIVDPGSAEARQYGRLLSLISGLKAEGMRPKAVLLTHRHADHIGGAKAVAERLKVPVWCHRMTAERLPFEVERTLEDDDCLELAGAPPLRLRVLHTPGHAPGHLCLWDEASRAAVVGDLVAGLGTVVIDPPEGDMAQYLSQLERLKQLRVSALYPGHGPVIPEGRAKLEEYLAHRAERERQLLEALAPEGSSVEELLPLAYPDTPREMYPVAERSALATLIKLERERKVSREGGRYLRAQH